MSIWEMFATYMLQERRCHTFLSRFLDTSSTFISSGLRLRARWDVFTRGTGRQVEQAIPVPRCTTVRSTVLYYAVDDILIQVVKMSTRGKHRNEKSGNELMNGH